MTLTRQVSKANFYAALIFEDCEKLSFFIEKLYTILN